MTAPDEILIIKPSSLGDIVHTLPAVALIKKHWPESHLRWVVNPEWAPLLEGNPSVDEIVIFPRGEFRGLRGLRKVPAWAKTVATRPADLVLDFQGLLRSVLIARLCRAKEGKIVGLSDAREGARLFHNRTVHLSGATHAVDRYLALVSGLGISVAPPLEWLLPQGQPPAGFAQTPPYVLLHPFSRGAGKSLTAADVTAFCQALAPMRVLLAGRSEETAPLADNVENLLNRTTLGELIWLIRHAAYTVSVDSGPMHIAAAFTSRLVSIHTWSDPLAVGPYQPDAWIWRSGALSQVKDLASPERHIPTATIAEVAKHVARQIGV
jgi:ADP-heptose:LPS heptosyltransferase